ncbi:hypothetical protein AB833_27310 [Chromatiales bacterium (ex Bugula neritina AB1)]|nr:hypothetical protein AB833_27310 [Chromatiales bacterium (ex Bugula neritina AB1)]
MKSLLLIAHGSRREASNEEIRELTIKLRQHPSNNADNTSCAFLELAEPSIPEGIQSCIDNGAKTIVVYPYFLSKGRHVTEDIPAEVARKKLEYPEIDIFIAGYFGAADEVVDLLAQQTSHALKP